MPPKELHTTGSSYPVTNLILGIELLGGIEVKQMKRRMALGRRDDPLSNGKPYQVGVGFQSELLHDAVLMKGDRARSEVQHVGGFLHGPAFGQQMQHFPLTRRQ